MGFAPFRQLGSLAKMGQAISTSMSSKLGMKPASQSPIGIDFGTGSLKVLQVSAGDPPCLVAAAQVETPMELQSDVEKRLVFQITQLPRIIREGGFKGKRTVCAIPGWATVCKHMPLPKSDSGNLDEAVASTIPVQLGRDPADLVYRYLNVSPAGKGGKLEVIVIAVERSLVQRLMSAMIASKLELVGMHSEFAAALHAFDYIHRREGDVLTNTLYLDIGQGTTTVAISHGKTLAFCRVVELGGRQLDDAVSRQLRCDLADARRKRWGDKVEQSAAMSMAERASGRSALADVSLGEDRRGNKAPSGFGPLVDQHPATAVGPERTDLSEPMDMLTDEVRMCLRFHGAQFPDRKVERVVFVGGESRHIGLCQHIAKALKLPAQMADPLARVARHGKEPCLGLDLSKPQPGWAVVMGLCLGPTDL